MPMALLEIPLEMLQDGIRWCASLILTLATLTHLCLWLVGRRVVRPRLYFKPSSLSRHLQRHMSALQRPFTVPRLLTPRHLQTLLGPLAAAAGVTSPPLLYRRQYLQLRDRCSVPLDWAEPLGGGTADPAARVLLVLPDLLLDDSRLYAPVCRRALMSGCLPVVVNFRQLVRNNLPAARVSALYDVTDLRWVVRYILAVCPGRRLAAIGFGNGGSLLLAYLGEHGISCQLTAAAVVSPAWSYSAHLLADACAPYAAIMTLREKYRLCRRATDSSAVSAKTAGDDSFADFHHRVHGEDEERHNPVIDIDEVSVPLLAVHADDDPVYGAAGLPLQLFTAFPHLFLLRAPLGGHCGFFTGNGFGGFSSSSGGGNGRSGGGGGGNGGSGGGGGGSESSGVSWAADTAVQFIDSVCGFLDAEDAGGGGAGAVARAARRVAARVARRSAAIAAANARLKNPPRTADNEGQVLESAGGATQSGDRTPEVATPTPSGAVSASDGVAKAQKQTIVVIKVDDEERCETVDNVKSTEHHGTSDSTHVVNVSERAAVECECLPVSNSEETSVTCTSKCISCGTVICSPKRTDENDHAQAPEAVEESSVARIREGAACDEDCVVETCVGEDGINSELQTLDDGSESNDKTISKAVSREGCLSDSSFQSVDNTQRETISNGDVSESSDNAAALSVNSVEHLLCTDILSQQLKHSAS